MSPTDDAEGADRGSGPDPAAPAGLDAAIVLVGDDAEALGELARRLRDEQGVRAAVFLGDPRSGAAPLAVVEMVQELFGRDRSDTAGDD